MKIGLDISALSSDFKEHALRGIGRYAFELERNIKNIISNENNSNSNISVESFRHQDIPIPKSIEKIISCLPFGRQTVRQQFIYPVSLKNNAAKKYDVMHFLAQTDAPSWCGMPYFVTVHDVIPLVLKDLYTEHSPTWRWKLARFLENKAIQNAKHIFTVSQHSARDINKYLNIPIENITVTYNGISEVFFNEPTKNTDEIRKNFNLDIDSKVLIYVGGIDPRKNALGLIDIFENLLERYLSENIQNLPKLFLVGKISQDKMYPLLQSKIKNSKFKNQIVEIGYLNDENLSSLYSISSAFVFPSLYEGFGLPPLEAAAAGVPVVSSNRSCLPEILEDGAILCDPDDHNRFSEYLWSLLNNTELALSLKESGIKQARKFSWHKTAQDTINAYEQFCRNKKL